MTKGLLLLALLPWACAPAQAYWVSEKAAAGSQDFASSQLSFGSSRAEGWGWQGGFGLYSLGGSGGVPSASGRLDLLRKENDLGLKAQLWPAHRGSSSLGLTLYSDTLTLADEELQTRMYWGIGAFHHRAPLLFKDGSSKTGGLSQLAVDGSLRQSFWGIFQLSASAAYFLYDRSMAELAGQGSLYDHGQTLALAALRPVRGFPRWTLGVQAARRADPGVDTVFYFGYSLVEYAGTLGRLDALQVGMDVAVSESLHLGPAYGLFIPKPGPTGHDFSLLLRWAP